MMKTVLKSVLCLFLSICMCGCYDRHVTTIVIASDLHYISDELYDDGDAFGSVVTHADGKYMPFIEEIVDAFVDRIIDIHPDVLVLSGDLTFNGEKLSHESLTQKLHTIEKAGIDISVIAGNHDIENPYARKYEDDEVLFTESISRDGFAEMYEEFGYGEAIYQDADSLSYVSEVDESTWLLMLDVNASPINNAFTADTLTWIEYVLQESGKQGVNVIAVSHQNLLQQSLFTDGFLIDNAKAVTDLFEEYGVRLHFSGHIHIQHYTRQNSLLECTVSALSVSPLQYGVVTVADHHVSFVNEQLDVSGWARKNRLDGYENFASYAKDFFIETGKNRKEEIEVEEDLLDAYMQLNCAYFSGDMRNIAIKEEISERWKEVDPYTWVYIQAMMQEKGNDYRSFETDLS